MTCRNGPMNCGWPGCGCVNHGLHNAHVQLFYRWRIWLARQSGRQLAETFLIEWHNEEFAKGAS